MSDAFILLFALAVILILIMTFFLRKKLTSMEEDLYLMRINVREFLKSQIPKSNTVEVLDKIKKKRGRPFGKKSAPVSQGAKDRN